MIEFDHADLAINAQASLLELNRSTIYHKHQPSNDTELANKIHEIYLKNRCIYGYRKITAALNILGVIDALKNEVTP